MKILIVGVNGKIGCYLVCGLVKSDYVCWVMVCDFFQEWEL